MRSRVFRWTILFLIVGAAGGAIWHYTRPDPVAVRVKAVGQGNVERVVANTRAGTVKACRRAKLSPSVGGQIAKLPIREGDVVKAGDLLLALWNDDLVAEAQLVERQAEASRARARAMCLQAEVAERESKRLVKLRKTGSASEEKTDRAVTEAKAFRADCKAAKASALMNQARIEVIKANLARTRLTAPFDGIVAQINGELNEYLTPSPPGIATPPAVDLIDNSCFYVNAPIDEVDAPDIVPGMPARVGLDALGDLRFEGKVRRIAPYVLDREKQARTVDVEVTFNRPDNIKGLLAGYSADVEIILDVRSKALRAPTEAVLDGNRVFVYHPEEGILEERTFEPGISNWDYTEVISGLKLNEQVVTNVDQPGLEDDVRAVMDTEEP
jgi:HlyD family secretion protein